MTAKKIRCKCKPSVTFEATLIGALAIGFFGSFIANIVYAYITRSPQQDLEKA
jgi:hypothetical protein